MGAFHRQQFSGHRWAATVGCCHAIEQTAASVQNRVMEVWRMCGKSWRA